MTIPPQDYPPTDAKTVPIEFPAGKWNMPAWMAKAFIESVFNGDRATYARHIMAVQSGEPAAKPGRKRGSGGQ